MSHTECLSVLVESTDYLRAQSFFFFMTETKQNRKSNLTHTQRNHTKQGHTLLTGDTCGGHRTGNPSLLHSQSAAPPARKDKHMVPSVFSL